MKKHANHRQQKSFLPPTVAGLLQQRTFAEFFAGIGLMRLGLEKQGWSIAFANDIARDKFEMYETNFQDAHKHFVIEDIHLLSENRVPTVTLATASFPCNDLSLAGMREGLSGKQSSAYWGFIRILEEMGVRRPPIVLLENVTGFLTSHEGRDFQAALLALNRIGYAVDAIIIDAARFVPQSRVRLFVIGSLFTGHRAWEVREDSVFYESSLRPKALAEFIFGHSEIIWDIRSLPDLPKREIDLSDILENLPESHSAWWSKERCAYLLGQMSNKHSLQIHSMINARKWSYGTVFRRVRNGSSMAELRTDGIAGCLRTPKGGSGRQILVKTGFGKIFVRLLTPRECARLMGANDFKITAPLNQSLFGFGDAVCVPVIEWIAEHYLNPLVVDLMDKKHVKKAAGY